MEKDLEVRTKQNRQHPETHLGGLKSPLEQRNQTYETMLVASLVIKMIERGKM